MGQLFLDLFFVTFEIHSFSVLSHTLMFFVEGSIFKFFKMVLWVDFNCSNVCVTNIFCFIKSHLFFHVSSRISNWDQNESETSNLSAIFDCFRISKFKYLDSFSLMLHSVLQMKLKRTQTTVGIGQIKVQMRLYNAVFVF